MPEDNQTKVCPLCAETIKTAAKVCPHCRRWQKKWSLQNPQIGLTLYALICFAVFGCLATFVDKLFGPKEEFAIYRNDITVVSSQFSHRVSGSESNIYFTVVGTLTNQSNIAWKDAMVEVQFLDKTGQLIDVIKANADYGGVVILPHGEVAFKVEGKAARPVSDYVAHKAVVRWAKDVHAW